MRLLLRHTFLFLVAGAAARADTTYHLTSDWSDAANPHSAWTLRAGTMPLPHVDWWQRQLGGWTSAQPGWAFSEDGNNRLPFWFRSNGTENFAHDWIAGDVVVHSQDDTNGVGTGPGNVLWTSPGRGHATISGAAWAGRNIGRANHWTLYVNQQPISDGQLDGSGPYTRANPFSFAAGSGGAGAVQNIAVAPGDGIRLEIVRTSLSGDFAGVDLTITFAPSCYANCDGSTSAPFLNVNDFICFQSHFAAGDAIANCDGSTASPVLNVNDFICFQGRFASGCSAP